MIMIIVIIIIIAVYCATDMFEHPNCVCVCTHAHTCTWQLYALLRGFDTTSNRHCPPSLVFMVCVRWYYWLDLLEAFEIKPSPWIHRGNPSHVKPPPPSAAKSSEASPRRRLEPLSTPPWDVKYLVALLF